MYIKINKSKILSNKQEENFTFCLFFNTCIQNNWPLLRTVYRTIVLLHANIIFIYITVTKDYSASYDELQL